jgi:hypothetical protein
MTSPATTRPSVSHEEINAALMRLPYEQWVEMPEAAAHVRALGLPRESLTKVIRTGRRRGVLRTRKVPELHETYVMRIAETLHHGGPQTTG